LLGQNNILDNADLFTDKTTQKTPRKRPENAQTAQKTTQKIISALVANSSATRKELAEIAGISEDGIKWNLNKLRKEGRIKRIGPDKGGHWEVIEILKRI